MGREFTATRAGERAGSRSTLRGSSSRVDGAAGSVVRAGRAVSRAIGAAWLIGGGTKCASVRAAGMTDVGVGWAIIGTACNTIVDISCMITAAGNSIATPIGSASLIFIVAMKRASIAGARLINVRIEVTPVGTTSLIVVLASYISHVISDLFLHMFFEVQGLTNLDGTTSGDSIVHNVVTRQGRAV